MVFTRDTYTQSGGMISRRYKVVFILFILLSGLIVVLRLKVFKFLKQVEDYLFLTESATKFVNGEPLSILIKKFESGYVPSLKD